MRRILIAPVMLLPLTGCDISIDHGKNNKITQGSTLNKPVDFTIENKNTLKVKE